jgi:hypothetical protein
MSTIVHGSVDATVPNALPSGGDPDGAGSLGMIGLLDPTFDNTTSTLRVRLDDFQNTSDDPATHDTLIYTEYPGRYDHPTVAVEWTGSLQSEFMSWLFAHGAQPLCIRAEWLY